MNEYQDQQNRDYRRIAGLLQYINGRLNSPPSLNELAEQAGISPFHLHRLFSRWAGISPQRFMHYLSLQHAKTALAQSHNLLETSLDVGLSGPGRLHDLFVKLEAMTPGAYKNLARGLEITYGVHPTPFGPCLIGITERGICLVEFLDAHDSPTVEKILSSRWPEAVFKNNPRRTAPLVKTLFAAQKPDVSAPISLLVKGTNFQVRVWEALLNLPFGAVCSYADIANQAGSPRASRAVGQAVSVNPIAWLIPCHRVIKKLGIPGSYRWGNERKRLMLAWESAQRGKIRHTNASRESKAEQI